MTLQTHSDECWRWHHLCAVARVERDEALLRQALGALKSIMEIDSHSALTETEADAINAKADAAIAALRERLGETK